MDRDGGVKGLASSVQREGWVWSDFENVLISSWKMGGGRGEDRERERCRTTQERHLPRCNPVVLANLPMLFQFAVPERGDVVALELVVFAGVALVFFAHGEEARLERFFKRQLGFRRFLLDFVRGGGDFGRERGFDLGGGHVGMDDGEIAFEFGSLFGREGFVHGACGWVEAGDQVGNGGRFGDIVVMGEGDVEIVARRLECFVDFSRSYLMRAPQGSDT